jgi:hypothetical protein
MMTDPIAREAWRREASHHAGHRNFRPHLRPVGANLMGLRGEQAFAERFGLKVDLTPRPGGDGNIDNRITLRVSFVVDCKAALIPKDLIVEVGKCKPNTIYVLCRYFEDTHSCSLVGWQWGSVLLKTAPKDYGKGVMNYWCPASQLRSMDELDERLER